MHSLRFELMSYLLVGNYDIKVLQHRSGKYNLLRSLFKMCSADTYMSSMRTLCCQWEWKLYKWAKSYYYMIKLLVSVTQFGQIWKRLNEITFDCGANFTDVKHLDGYDWWRLCCVSTDTADGTIQILMSKVHPMVTINCLWRYFLLLVMSLCWWWKICAARRRNPSGNRSEGPGGAILPLDTMNHHFATITKVYQRFQWKLSPNGSFIYLRTVWPSAGVFIPCLLHVSLTMVCLGGVHRCWHRVYPVAHLQSEQS